jgi:hypothetical protein
LDGDREESEREHCFVELYCDMEQLQEATCRGIGPTTASRRPPAGRSYFRFDPVAVEWGRDSCEMIGEPLPPEVGA